MMKKSITTKEKILAECKIIAKEKGFEGLGMREVASALDIALGTIYNYFPSKSALILSTIASIWSEGLEKVKKSTSSSLLSLVDELYSSLLAVENTYHGFLSLHSSLIGSKEKEEGRVAMTEYVDRICRRIENVINDDTSIDKKELYGKVKPSVFSRFILDNIISSVSKDNVGIEALKAILEISFCNRIN